MKKGPTPRCYAFGTTLFIALLCLANSAHTQESNITRVELNKRIHDCATIEDCIAVMRLETTINVGRIFEDRFLAFGDAAIPPMMNLLAGEDRKMRRYAGQILWTFPSIGEEWLPLLLREDAEGDMDRGQGSGWLGATIGRVGNDAALSYLFDRMAENPDRGIYDVVGSAILRNGKDRILPHVRIRMEGFVHNGDPRYLHNLIDLALGGYGNREWPAPDWVGPALVRIAREPEFSVGLRNVAEYALRRFHHDIALAAQLRDFRAALADLKPQYGLLVNPSEYVPLQWGYWHYEIAAFDGYGERAREAGPMIAIFLTRADYPEARSTAALTIGRIGYREAIPALIALRSSIDDDWLLAYEVIEALGRLKAFEARGLLNEVASSHWHGAVRANAERALNFLDGGAWERPGVANDGTPRHTGEHVDFSPLRYAGDDREHPTFRGVNCSGFEQDRDSPLILSQAPLTRLRWPKRGWIELMIRPPTARSIANIPNKIRNELGRGMVTLIEPARGMLIGTHAGEFIGALDHVNGSKRVTRLLSDNVAFAFRHADQLFVVTGLSHLMISEGTLWGIDTDAPVPRVARRIPLPSEVDRILLTDKHVVVLKTDDGDVAIDAGGRVIDPDSPAVCVQNSRDDG